MSQPTATTTAPAPVPLTAEERKKQGEELYASMGWGKPPVDPNAPVAAPAAPARPAPAAVPAPNMVDSSASLISQTAKATATEVARAIREQITSPAATATPAAEPQAFTLSEEDQEIYNVLVYLETAKPNKFAGKATEFLEYVKKHYAYMDQWRAANPGKEYNQDDEEHNAWYEANEPDIDPDDIDNGKIDMRVDEGVNRKYQQTVKPQLDAIEFETNLEKHQPTIVLNVERGILSMVEQVDPALAAFVKDEQGNPAITADNVAKIDEQDSIAKEVLDNAAKAMTALLVELEQSAVEELKYVLKPSSNKVHAQIYKFQQKVEKDIAASPDRQVRDGKRFVTVADMQAMRDEVRKSKVTHEEKLMKLDAIDEKYWTLTVDDVSQEIISHFAKLSKDQIQARDKTARKKYRIPEPQPAAEVPPTQEPPAPSPSPAPTPAPAPMPSRKPNSPAITTQSDVVSRGLPGGGSTKTFGEQVSDALFR